MNSRCPPCPRDSTASVSWYTKLDWSVVRQVQLGHAVEAVGDVEAVGVDAAVGFADEAGLAFPFLQHHALGPHAIAMSHRPLLFYARACLGPASRFRRRLGDQLRIDAKLRQEALDILDVGRPFLLESAQRFVAA
jgi:hypothetical protein